MLQVSFWPVIITVVLTLIGSISAHAGSCSRPKVYGSATHGAVAVHVARNGMIYLRVHGRLAETIYNQVHLRPTSSALNFKCWSEGKYCGLVLNEQGHAQAFELKQLRETLNKANPTCGIAFIQPTNNNGTYSIHFRNEAAQGLWDGLWSVTPYRDHGPYANSIVRRGHHVQCTYSQNNMGRGQVDSDLQCSIYFTGIDGLLPL